MRRALTIVCLLLFAAPAFAQNRTPAKPRTKTPREFRLFAYGATESTESKSTFEAVLDNGNFVFAGGGAEVVIGRHWILRGTYASFSDTGTRVFVDTDDSVFPLGIPLDVTVRPLDLSAAYRFHVKPAWALFAGGGFTRYQVTEKSNGEVEDASGSGWHLIAGLEAKPHRRVLLGGEIQWTRTGVILEGGAAEALGEGKLGGLRFGVRAGVVF